MPANPQAKPETSAPARQSSERAPEVFISYSHDSEQHVNRVLKLANRLRTDGIDATIDQEENPPPLNWRSWLQEQIEQSDFVLVICSATYRRRFYETGGEVPASEEVIIHRWLRERGSQEPKFLPVIFERTDGQFIPDVFPPGSLINLSSRKGYGHLLRTLGLRPGQSKAGQGGTTQGPETKPGTESLGGGTPATEVDFAKLKQSDFTQYAWDVLQAARRLGESQPKPLVCSVRRLVTAIMLSGFEDEKGAYTGGWLLRQIEDGGRPLVSGLVSLLPGSYEVAGIIPGAVEDRVAGGNRHDRVAKSDD